MCKMRLSSINSYLYVSCSGSRLWQDRAYLSAIVYLKLFVFCSEKFPLPLGSWDGSCYFIVALFDHDHKITGFRYP